ncbi:Nucleolar protein [Thalictrum thalictroides]|uniref:Nucleolar protein n=1 Tax=Thalictrum thalictroides TaxID=46969 RepID=A0A7J6X0L8_THATH|nr:Nucleolar protein [Thalictrum thalictroides]
MFAAVCARHRLHRIRAQFCEDIKNPEQSCWPSLKTLFLLRFWFVVFPCSDYRHVVTTPSILLICEYLMRCPITTGRDTVIGSFLCSMVLSVARQSQKFYPEAVIFLRTLLMSALETESKLLQHSQFYYLSELKMLNPWLRLHSCVSEVQPLDFPIVMNIPESSPFFNSDSFRASVLMSVCQTLRGFVDTYEGYNSFPEIFLPVSTLLREVARQEYVSGALQDTIKDVSELIERKADEYHMLRQPLQMRKQKPMPIKLLNPKFEENFVKGRDYDPDRERAEGKKLKKEYNRERKGAARELRKDNQFLFALKERDRALREEERTEKYGKARAFLQEQEHAFKSGQLGKGRKRRR